MNAMHSEAKQNRTMIILFSSIARLSSSQHRISPPIGNLSEANIIIYSLSSNTHRNHKCNLSFTCQPMMCVRFNQWIYVHQVDSFSCSIWSCTKSKRLISNWRTTKTRANHLIYDGDLFALAIIKLLSNIKMPSFWRKSIEFMISIRILHGKWAFYSFIMVFCVHESQLIYIEGLCMQEKLIRERL